MDNPIISASVFFVIALLWQGVATNASFYVHPDHARKSDQKFVPKWSRVFVKHHDFMKRGSVVFSWACFAMAQVIKPHSAAAYQTLLAGSVIGAFLFGFTLNWRIYAVIEGGRGPDEEP